MGHASTSFTHILVKFTLRYNLSYSRNNFSLPTSCPHASQLWWQTNTKTPKNVLFSITTVTWLRNLQCYELIYLFSCCEHDRTPAAKQDYKQNVCERFQPLQAIWSKCSITGLFVSDVSGWVLWISLIMLYVSTVGVSLPPSWIALMRCKIDCHNGKNLKTEV